MEDGGTTHFLMGRGHYHPITQLAESAASSTRHPNIAPYNVDYDMPAKKLVRDVTQQYGEDAGLLHRHTQ